MGFSAKDKGAAAKRRHRRVRKKVKGTAERPRLSVFRSLNNIYAQIIDDVDGKTIVSASSLGLDGAGNAATAATVGTRLAEAAKAVDIESVVFDRGARLYHGRVKALAESARAAGLSF